MKWLRVRFKSDAEELDESGVLLGVDEGWLIVRRDDGTIETFSYGSIVESQWVSDPTKKVRWKK